MNFTPIDIQGREAPASSWASIGVNHLGWVEAPQVRLKPGPRPKPKPVKAPRRLGLQENSRPHRLWKAMLRAGRPLRAGDMAHLLGISTNEALDSARCLMRHRLVTRTGQRCHYLYTAHEDPT